MQLNGPAHKLIGQEAGLLVKDHKTVTPNQHQSSGSSDQESDQQGENNFDLKFPPGY